MAVLSSDMGFVTSLPFGEVSPSPHPKFLAKPADHGIGGLCGALSLSYKKPLLFSEGLACLFTQNLDPSAFATNALSLDFTPWEKTYPSPPINYLRKAFTS